MKKLIAAAIIATAVYVGFTLWVLSVVNVLVETTWPGSERAMSVSDIRTWEGLASNDPRRLPPYPNP